LNSIQAKFAAYNSYWRRTLRQIENGTYARNLSKIGRAAARSGADIPEEILAAMPKRMREQVLKDREVALAAARRNNQVDDEPLSLESDEPAFVKEGTELRRQVRGAHVVKEDADFDLDAFFKEVEGGDAGDKTPEDQPPVMPPPAPARVSPPQGPATRASAGSPSTTGALPRMPTGPVPNPNATGPMPAQRATGPVPTVPSATGQPPQRATGPVPTIPGIPAIPGPARAPMAPSQAARPNPIAPGSAAAHGAVPVESMAGPFPRQATTPGTEAPVRTPTGPLPNPGATGPVPRPIGAAPSGPVRTPTGPVPNPNATGPMPRQPTGPVPNPNATGPMPRQPTGPNQVVRPPGAPRPAPPVSAQSQPTRPTPKPEAPGSKPPPGMTDADVNALYAKFVKAKESVGEKVGPGGYGKLLSTINQQAPKIMEQYKAKGVDFSVVVKDNQVIIRAKPKP
jgi:hypothetical protein